jgi:hypothetical protein
MMTMATRDMILAGGVLGLVAAHLPLHLREQAIQGVLAFPACRRRCLLEIEIR